MKPSPCYLADSIHGCSHRCFGAFPFLCLALWRDHVEITGKQMTLTSVVCWRFSFVNGAGDQGWLRGPEAAMWHPDREFEIVDPAVRGRWAGGDHQEIKLKSLLLYVSVCQTTLMYECSRAWITVWLTCSIESQFVGLEALNLTCWPKSDEEEVQLLSSCSCVSVRVKIFC